MIFARYVARDITQAHLSILAETCTRSAGSSVQRDKPRVQRGFKKTPTDRIGLADLLRYRSAIEPRCDTPIDQAITVIPFERYSWIIGPTLKSSFRIECDDPVKGSREIKHSVHQ